MIKQHSGHIVTVASLAGMTGCDRLVDYCSSKFAAIGFDESLRTELAVGLLYVDFISGKLGAFFLLGYYKDIFVNIDGWSNWN